MKNLRYVGRDITREDAYDKARGKIKYVGDMKRCGMIYGKLILSEKAHADVEIDVSEAVKSAGTIAIYTYADIPKVKYNSFEWFKGMDAGRDEYLLTDKAKFAGDRIALVLGNSRLSVERAIAKVSVAYKECDSVITLAQAVRANTIIHEPDNVAFSKVLQCKGEDYLQEAAYTVADTGFTSKIHHAAIEPHVCMAEIDEQGSLTVWTPCQAVNQVQMHISNILNIPYNRIRVIKGVTGGSFGGKSQPVLEPLAAFAALKLNRPVMLYMDRQDAIKGTVSRNAAQITVSTDIDKSGKILSRSITADIDGGGYETNASAITAAIGKKLFRLYDIENQSYRGTAYYTNTIPGGACRGYGSPQAHAITEINIDNAARKLGMDPCEFRLINLVKPWAKDPTGAPMLGNASIKECVITGMREFGWQHRRMHVKEKNTYLYFYGVGMACATHSNGYYGAFPDFTNVDMTMFADGSVLVKISVHDQGCGTITTLRQIAAEALDICVERIRITEADSLFTPYDSAGTQASRVTYVCGGAVKAAGEKLKQKIINSYCKLKNLHPKQVIAENGAVRDKDACNHMLYEEIAVENERLNSEIMSVSLAYKSPNNPASFAANFVEIRVNRYTGMVDVIDCLAVHDIGRAINKKLAEGQVQGGAHMAIGMALREKIEIAENGAVKSDSFSQYHLITSAEMPDVKVIFIENGEPGGPYGAKSVGEIAAVALAPAIINAINFALGTNITEYPAVPEKIVEAIQNLR